MVVSELIRVECEQCGKKYGIDSVHVKGDRAKIRCVACKGDIVISRPKKEAPAPVTELPGWVEEVDDISMPTQHDPHADLIAELSDIDASAEALFPDFDIAEPSDASQDDAISRTLSLLEGDDDDDTTLEFPDWDIADSAEPSGADTSDGFPAELALQAELELTSKKQTDMVETLDFEDQGGLDLEAELDLPISSEDDLDIDMTQWSLDNVEPDEASRFSSESVGEDIELTLPEWVLQGEGVASDDDESDIELALPEWTLKREKDTRMPAVEETDTLAGLLMEEEMPEDDGNQSAVQAKGERSPSRLDEAALDISIDDLTGDGGSDDDFGDALEDALSEEMGDDLSDTLEDALSDDMDDTIGDDTDMAPVSDTFEPPAEFVDQPVPHVRSGGLGLTSKFLLFAIVPLFIISFLSIMLVTWENTRFQKNTQSLSIEALKEISEGLVKQMTTSVTRQARQYIKLQPYLSKESFNQDLGFKRVLLQRIGRTGFTGLYEIGSETEGWRFWANFDNDIVGKELHSLRSKMKGDFNDFWRILTGVKSGKASSGYCRWPDKNGRLKDVYMVCQPIQDTPYAIASVVFSDELDRPLRRIEEAGESAVKNVWRFNGLIMGGGVLLIALILFIYSRGITDKIRQ